MDYSIAIVMKLFVAALVMLLNIGVPIATLVLVYLIYRNTRKP
jgi:hypothetical protein